MIEEADGYSFPSGHVMHYVVFLGTLAFVLSTSVKPGVNRWLIQGAVVAVLMAVGLSRVYLGVHLAQRRVGRLRGWRRSGSRHYLGLAAIDR